MNYLNFLKGVPSDVARPAGTVFVPRLPLAAPMADEENRVSPEIIG